MNSAHSLTLTRPQLTILGSQARFKSVVCGRRFGKTYTADTELYLKAARKPNQHVWYVAPTYGQAKLVNWDTIKTLIHPSHVRDTHETELSIRLVNNSIIRLVGADRPDRLRGPGLDHVSFDEHADIKPETWFKVIFPALADKQGTASFYGTPKGYNWAYDLHQSFRADPNCAVFSFTTAEGGNVSEKELAYARDSQDERTYRQEFLASFETLAGRVYDMFDRAQNVRPVEDKPQLKDQPQPDLLVGMDFNILPMSAVLAVSHGEECHVFNEIVLPVSNTEEMATEIRSRYPNRRIIVCPDPSGKARKTSAPVGETDFTILRRHGFIISAPDAAPAVVDRINNTQAMLKSALGTRRLLINPRCKQLIKALDGLTYKPGTSQPMKGGENDLTHQIDALGYLCWQKFNLLRNKAQWVVSTAQYG